MSKVPHTRPPILLVDDRPENLLALEAVLASASYDLVRANSGREAISYLIDGDCALILLDVQMPIMDGFETALRIRTNPKTKNIPIIFITASLEDRERTHQGYEVGAIDYLFKPFQPEILRSKVSIFVELYLAKLEIKFQSELLSAQDKKNVDIVLENALDAVVGMNDEGNVIYWNPQAELIFGWTKDEALGLSMSELIIPFKFRILHEQGLRNFLSQGVGPILNKRIEVLAMRKDGREFPVELTVSPIERGGTFTFTAFVRDISERKQIEENKKIEKKLLVEALKSRDDFISICSHELKTPVTAMKLQFQMAKRLIDKGDDKVFSRDASTRRVEMAISQLDRMIRLITDMLDVSKITSGKLQMSFQRVDLKLILEEVLERFKDQLESTGLSLSYTTTIPHALINGDPYRLEQVISNLIINAIKYGADSPISVSLFGSSTKYHFCIQDRGIEIERENLDKIFSKFERAIVPNEISGLGLGLFISKQIIDAHKGTIEVVSEKGHGSTFTVILPAFEIETVASATGSDQKAPPS